MLTLCFALLVTAADAPLAEPAPVAVVDPDAFRVTGLDRDQLWNLRLKLEEERPGFGFPSVVLGLGVVSAVLGGGGVAAGALAPANQTIKGVFYGSGGALILAGAALATWGALWLDRVFKQRRIVGLKVEAVDQALKRLDVPSPAPAATP